MGTKKITHIEPLPSDQAPVWQDRLTLNLKMKTSDAFKDPELTPE